MATAPRWDLLCCAQRWPGGRPAFIWYPYGPSEAFPRVGDGGREAEIDLRDARLRQRLVADYRAEQQRITHFLRRLSAPLLMISNQGDVVEQVRRLLGVPARSANG